MTKGGRIRGGRVSRLQLAAGVLVACLAACLAGGTARAQLIMGASPGPLSNAHKDLQCTQCHSSRTDVPSAKCLSCHEPIAQRIKEKRGPHGIKKAMERECKLCHGEHRGLKGDILGFATFGGKKEFDHRITGFTLAGKHAGIECEKCHKQKTTLGATTFLKLGPKPACGDCHKSPHGEMPKPLLRCERCHDDRSWKAINDMVFDHQRDTRYPLVGKHVGVKCESCHEKALYHLPSASPDCARCHKNVHGDSLFGQKHCELCHSNTIPPWKEVSFDHDRRTHFLLRGPHEVDCAKCHKPAARTKPGIGCASASCHTDVHNARFNQAPLQCASCHPARPATTWKDIRFDHKQLTRFALTGKHALAACRDCHRGKGPADFERFSTVVTSTGVACRSCHRHAEAHKGDPRATQKCLECHKTPGVIAGNVNALSQAGHGAGKPFQLVGPHNISCGKCHRGSEFKGLSLGCAGATCHKDPHEDALGKECLRCHEGVRWQAVLFDHQKSAYPLTGKHRDVSCEGCHPGKDQRVKWRPVPTSCGAGACHGNARDDVHKGTLGECQRCHNDNSWKQIAFDHDKRWPLQGKHRQVKCATCHPGSPLYKPPAPTACAGCHEKQDVHKNDFGPRCERCHDALAWKQVHNGHAAATPEPFGGAHNRLPCATCHSGGRILRGMATMCMTCHQREDIHHNSLGPRCSECHTQQTFAGARFNHDTVGCTLRGIHRVLTCVDCHRGGSYSGLSPACISCHRDDALRAPVNRVVHITTMECTGCHTVNSFKQQSAATSPPESVCQ